MNLDGYEFLPGESLFIFEFFSEGPKGKVKKVIRFGLKNADGNSYFNLSFGDLNEQKKKIDDLVVTNNQDKQKVLVLSRPLF